MPNFKIFQDNPDKARIKIYGSQGIAISTDLAGNIGITSTGLVVTAPANGLLVTAPETGLAVTPPAAGLLVTSTGLAVTAPADGLLITSAGLAVTAPTGGLLVTSPGLAVISTLATTDVSEVMANITDTAGSPGTTFDVLNLRTWTFGVVNASTTVAPAVVKLQMSPDGANWIDEAGPVTLNTGEVTSLVSSVFMKYARIYYAAVDAASAVTLNIFFQGQS